jgi:ABC-type transport system involved in multi-copper enzyme maturation permease subunit
VKVAAILIDTARELLYRKTLWVYAGAVTLTLLGFTLVLRADVVNGLIGSLTVLGGQVHLGQTVLEASELVGWLQAGTAFVLYPLGILLSVFATASLVPRMVEKGTIDLLLSKPISRPALFLSRYLGAWLVTAATLVYLVGGLGAILALKTGVWNGGFLLSGLVIAIYFGCLLAFLVLAGVVLRSTTTSIMVAALVYVVSLGVAAPHANADWPLLITSHVWRALSQGLVEALYHALPRTYDIGQLAGALILHQGTVAWGPLLGSMASGGAALALATVYFMRKDY